MSNVSAAPRPRTKADLAARLAEVEQELERLRAGSVPVPPAVAGRLDQLCAQLRGKLTRNEALAIALLQGADDLYERPHDVLLRRLGAVRRGVGA